MLLNMEVVPHPPYSPVYSPSDYHFFRLLLLHDNSRLLFIDHVTQEKIMLLNKEVALHPPHSPDKSPSDYHLLSTLLYMFCCRH